MDDYSDLTHGQFCECVVDVHNIFSKGISDAMAFKILTDHFLGPDSHIRYSCGKRQANTEMVAKTLLKYPAGKVK